MYSPEFREIPTDVIKFWISSAGLAGSPRKLLYGESENTGTQYYTLVDINSFWSIKRGRKRIIKKFKVLKNEII